MSKESLRICDTCGGELQHVGGVEYYCHDCLFFLRESQGILRRVYRPAHCPKEDGTTLSPCAIGYTCLKDHRYEVTDRLLLLVDLETGRPTGETWPLDANGELETQPPSPLN